MTWGNDWGKPADDPRDAMSKDDVLLAWQNSKNNLEAAKVDEMEWRKYVVKRAFPDGHEGTNKQELGNGYELKAKIKYSYKLDKDNKKIWDALDRIAKIGNRGAFIAERLVSWNPNFLLSEYRPLLEEKDESPEAMAILKEISSFLTITEAAPELEIKEPKGKQNVK